MEGARAQPDVGALAAADAADAAPDADAVLLRAWARLGRLKRLGVVRSVGLAHPSLR